jgi:hypothetical protein
MKVLVDEHMAVDAPSAVVVRWVERNPVGSISIDVGVSHIDDLVTGSANGTVHRGLKE